MNQDFVAWVGQSALSDRTQEHLGESDRGVIMMRKRMLEQTELVARGGEPKAVIRDPVENACVQLRSSAESTSSAATPERTATSGAGVRRARPSVRTFPSWPASRKRSGRPSAARWGSTPK